MEKEKILFTEEEFNEFAEPNTTNNYLFEPKVINGITYYIKLN